MASPLYSLVGSLILGSFEGLVGGLVLWSSGEVWFVDIVVLPVGLQTPSAPTVLALTFPLGPHAQSNVWLYISASVLVQLWQSLSGDS